MGAPLVVVASTTKSSEGVAAASFLDAEEESLDQVIALLHRDSEGVQIRRRHRAAAANSALTTSNGATREDDSDT